MNYFKYIIVSLAALFTFSSCSDFLDAKPQGVISEDLLNSAEGVEYLVNTAYAALAGADPRGDIWWRPTTNWIQGGVRSDDAYKGSDSNTDGWEAHAYETFSGVVPTIGLIDDSWYRLYVCVQRCNSALRVLNNLIEEEVPDRKSRIGEMKVLRAHFYFELCRQWNKIPYFDETVENTNEAYAAIPNNEFSREEILGKIADDLEVAAGLLPETQVEVGRIHKFIAYAYKAKVKLYQAYEQDPNTNQVININLDTMKEVVDLCDKVMGSHRYDLLQDFQHLDLLEYENGVESIFAVQYSMEDGSDNVGRVNWSNLLNTPRGPGYNGDGFYLPSQNLVNAFQTSNGLPMFNNQFNQHDFNLISPYVNNQGETEYNITNVDHEVDPRLDFIIGRMGIPWKTWTVDVVRASWVRGPAIYGYNCNKRFWLSPEDPNIFNGWPWGQSPLNWQIIRFADILLWKAEALIEIGGGANLEEARGLINRVRERAKNSEWVRAWDDTTPNKRSETEYAANYNIALYTAADFSNQDFAREAVHFETRLEKAMEGERFFDLVRWGIAGDVMNEYLQSEVRHREYYKDTKFTKGKDEYFPVPQNQINFSYGLYKQNPGY